MKHILLWDRLWLENKYIFQQMSMQQICDEIGVKSKTSVKCALKRYNIPIRSKRFAKKGFSSYDLLNDKEWLFQKYIIESKGLNEIAKLSQSNAGVVRGSLKNFDIPVRNKSDGWLAVRNSDGMSFDLVAMQVINGSLMGDGSLFRKGINACFYKKNIHFGHIEYVAKYLFPETYSQRIKGPYEYTKKPFVGDREIINPRPYYIIQSLVHKELTNIYDKWYVNGIKIIPKDIVITPLLLSNWFMDDGYSYWHKNMLQVFLCSQSFSKEDKDFICFRLKEDAGINAKPERRGVHYLINISCGRDNIKSFYNYIGDCPVDCFRYKWKL